MSFWSYWEKKNLTLEEPPCLFNMSFPNLPQVHPKHVKEAFRLLNKSIIRVETPDINLDQDDEQQLEDQEDQDGVNGKLLVKNFFKGESTSSLVCTTTNS